MNDNRCVCCGKIIPEGWQVCGSCERKAGRHYEKVYQVHLRGGWMDISEEVFEVIANQKRWRYSGSDVWHYIEPTEKI